MKKISILLILMVLFTNCRHDKHEIAMPIIETPCWQQLVGNYVVYDTTNHINYNMSIIHKDSIQTQLGYANLDSLIITNYGNRFNLRVGYMCYNLPNILRAVCGNPVIDHNNKRWSLSIHADDPTTTKIENQLKNDTIILYFNMDNIAYFSTDGVPYFSGDIKHIAVKQH